MKKRLLSVAAMAIVALGVQAAVGDDVTGKYLTNADFSQDQPMTAGICTYAKDVADNNTTFSGMQPVIGWTESNPLSGTDIDARAAGVYAVGGQYADADFTVELFLGGGGYLAPVANSLGQDAQGQVLGIVGVWTAGLTYTQEVTLPAGAYTLEIPVYNAGGEDPITANKFGFIAADGTAYLATNTTWPTQTWETMSVTFLLKEQTTGVISLGYTAANLGSAKMPHLFIDCVKILEADAEAIELEEIQKVKDSDLLPLLEKGDELGVNTSAGWAVYNNDSATMQQVLDAIENQKNLNEAGMTDFTDFFISNAHFALGTPADCGVCTYDYDMPANNTHRFGMQSIDMWEASNLSDNIQRMASSSSTPANPLNSRAAGLFAVGSGEEVWLGSAQDKVPATKANGSTEGNVFGFISVWTGTAYYTQNVTLPAGSYTITIPTYNERGTTAIAKNLCGFIADDGTEYLATSTTFPVGVWSNETIEFTLEEETSGVISIGYTAANAGSGNMPHLFIDEFTLMFNGLTDIDPSLIALSGTIRNAENVLYTDDYFYAELKNELEEAIEEGNDLVNSSSSDETANTAANAKINGIISNIRTSINKYKEFDKFISGKLTSTRDLYDVPGGELTSFADELSDLIDEYTSQMEGGSITDAEIDEIVNGFDQKVIDVLQAAFEAATTDGEEHELNITALFADKNLGYDASNVDGWANETGTKNFKSTDQVAEVWNDNAFNVHQTLENLPAGLYELRVPAFYRTADNATNYTSYIEGTVEGNAYIYAGGNKTAIINVASIAKEGADDYYTTDAGGVFVPNDKASAHAIFTTDEESTMNIVRTALLENGDLTIGVMADGLSGNSWVVWEGFTVIYKGTVGMNNALYEQIQTLAQEAMQLNDRAAIVAEADSKINEAVGTADELTAESDMEELTAGIAGLKEAIAYATESVALVDELGTTTGLYQEYLVPSTASDDESFDDVLETINIALQDGFEDNAQVSQMLLDLKSGWTKHVMYDCLQAGDATETEPYDISAAIINNKFAGIIEGRPNTEGWDATYVGKNNFGLQFGVFESYESESFDIHQTISGLAEGYYLVKVQGFYRAGSNQDNANAYSAGEAGVHNVIFFANETEVPFNNQLENGSNGEMIGVGDEPAITYGGNEEYHVPNNREALSEQFALDLYWNEIVYHVGAEGGAITLGLKKETGVAADWAPFGNFQLYYLGTAQPTAIESIAADENGAIFGQGNAIYGVDGQLKARLTKGVNIVRKTMSDGSVRIQKILVK